MNKIFSIIIALGLVLIAPLYGYAADGTAVVRGQHDEAEAFFEGVVKVQPENANAHFDLGNVYFLEKRYSEALVHYNKANKLGLPSSRMDSYYFNTAACHAGMGDTKEAIVRLKECLKINPRHSEAKGLLDLYNGSIVNK